MMSEARSEKDKPAKEQDREVADQLSAARRGSHAAFRRLVEQYEDELRRHCYRITGSVDDADDMVQETLMRAWRGLGTYQGRGSFRAWLYQISSNRSLDLVKSAARRWEDVGPEPPWLQPFPTETEPPDPADLVETAESLELAFIVALQRLTPAERCTLILRDVLGFSANEAAAITGLSPAAVHSSVRRARKRLADVQPKRAEVASTDAQRTVAAQFVEAWNRGDVDDLLSLCSSDLFVTMPPVPLSLNGPAEMIEFLRAKTPSDHLTDIYLELVGANGQFGAAAWIREQDTHVPLAVMVFNTSPAQEIDRVTAFVGPNIFDLFNLPKQVIPANRNTQPPD